MASKKNVPLPGPWTLVFGVSAYLLWLVGKWIWQLLP